MQPETTRRAESGKPLLPAKEETLVPVWLQLPKPPARCPISSLSRTKLNELILPCHANGFKPPVRSKSLTNSKFATRGIRLYHVPSLLEYIESQEANGTTTA